jgi:catechol 2,3-dioxygenase-like lactoylglutathione lyase family enzyme
MSVVGLNHFNLTAPWELLEQVRDFYVDVVGLTVGDRPDFARKGFWLYAGDKPIVHLIACRDGDVRAHGEAAPSFIDHIAFTCKGLSEVVERLKGLGIVYKVTEAPSRGQVQIFVRDPAGVGIELNFEK